jgi:hypothetical protein
MSQVWLDEWSSSPFPSFVWCLPLARSCLEELSHLRIARSLLKEVPDAREEDLRPRRSLEEGQGLENLVLVFRKPQVDLPPVGHQ